jgi:hypothetical protein
MSGVPVAFHNRRLKLEDIPTIDEFDVVLLLSVHHQVSANNSLEYGDEFLFAIARKARQAFFFQPACIQGKYGNNKVPFADNNFSEIIAHFSKIITENAGFDHVEMLGFSKNGIPPREPLRPLLMFTRGDIKFERKSSSELLGKAIQRAEALTGPFGAQATARRLAETRQLAGRTLRALNLR